MEKQQLLEMVKFLLNEFRNNSLDVCSDKEYDVLLNICAHEVYNLITQEVKL